MRLAVVFVAMLGLLALGCDAGEDHAAVAEQVAGQWAEDSMEEAVDLVVELVMDSPVVSEALESVPSLAAGAAKYALGRLIAEQVDKRLTWTIQGVSPQGGDIYHVTSKVSVTAEADLPSVGPLAYTAILPIRIVVNVADRTVEDWTADLGAATVRSTTS